MELSVFFKHLEGGVFKLLPLWEEQCNGRDVHLDLYIQDLLDEMVGAQTTFPDLLENGQYVSLLNTIQYMAAHECSHAAWKRKVLKMMRTLNEMGGRCHDV